MVISEVVRTNPLVSTESSRVLLIDDNEAMRRGLARYLELQGLSVTVAHDGATGLAELEAGEPFPVVLTDLRLPDRDGLQIAHRAREISPTTWVGLITGWDVDQDDPALDCIDAILLKPIDAADLLVRLRRVLAGLAPVTAHP